MLVIFASLIFVALTWVMKTTEVDVARAAQIGLSRVPWAAALSRPSISLAIHNGGNRRPLLRLSGCRLGTGVVTSRRLICLSIGRRDPAGNKVQRSSGEY